MFVGEHVPHPRGGPLQAREPHWWRVEGLSDMMQGTEALKRDQGGAGDAPAIVDNGTSALRVLV